MTRHCLGNTLTREDRSLWKDKFLKSRENKVKRHSSVVVQAIKQYKEKKRKERKEEKKENEMKKMRKEKKRK